jgi:hypothetical protein
VIIHTQKAGQRCTPPFAPEYRVALRIFAGLKKSQTQHLGSEHHPLPSPTTETDLYHKRLFQKDCLLNTSQIFRALYPNAKFPVKKKNVILQPYNCWAMGIFVIDAGRCDDVGFLTLSLDRTT